MYRVKQVVRLAPPSSLRERYLWTSPSQAPVHPLPKPKTFLKVKKTDLIEEEEAYQS